MITLGILSAMPEEIALLATELKGAENKCIGGREYISGQLFNSPNIRTVVAFSRWGKVASASTATTLINEYNIDYLIFTGVAASIHPDVKIGDIVIAQQLYQHDMDARPIFSKYEIPLTQKKFLTPCPELVSYCINATQNYLEQLTTQSFSHPSMGSHLKKFSITQPRLHQGIVATGDKFVNHKQQIDDIKQELDEASAVLAVEMEGAAVAQVCEDHQVPFCIIRTISDYADNHAAIDFNDFVTSIAKNYSHGVIENFYQKFSPRTIQKTVCANASY